MKIEIRGTRESCTKIVVTLTSGAEFDITEQFGALRIVTDLDGQDFCIRPAASNVVELSVRDRISY